MLELTLYSIVNWISGMIFLMFAVFLSTGSKVLSTRIYAAVSASLALWSFGVALLVSDPGIYPNWPLFFSRFNHFIGGFAGPLFLYFSYVFPEEPPSRKSFLFAFVVLEALLGYLFLFTNGLISSAFVVLQPSIDIAWTLGPQYYVFYLTFVVPFAAGIGLLLRKYLLHRGEVLGTKIGYLLLASTLGASLGMVVNVILPFFEIYTYSWLGPVFTISWVALTSYVIARYEALRLRTIIPVIAFLTLLMILFLNIFVG